MNNMNNWEIRIALAKHMMRHWELAKLMGISEFTLSRKLREELPEEEKDRIIQIIEKGAAN